jgi:Metallo-peptidase family M12/PA14 domain/Bacterial Ig domain
MEQNSSCCVCRSIQALLIVLFVGRELKIEGWVSSPINKDHPLGWQEDTGMLTTLARGAVVLCCVASSALAQVQSFRIDGSQVEHARVNMVKPGEHVRIEKMSIPGAVVDLELDRVTMFTDDAQILVGSIDGTRTMDRPDVVILSGIVAGDAQSMAYLAISPYGTNGFIELNGDLISISTGPYAQGKDLHNALKAARMNDVLGPQNGESFCGYTAGDAALEPNGPMVEYAPSTDRGTTTCRIAGIALDSDWEFTDRIFNGNANASAAYLVSVLGAISEIYQRDVDVRFAIPFLRVWEDDSDPYSPAGGDPLDQLRAEWNANMTGVNRTVTHLYTGRTDVSYGGVAYLSVLCNGSYGYGVSAYLNGSFPYPLVDHNSGNWDVVVTSHELGHNFGTGHTHDSYNPVIDGCGNGDCSAAWGGTIMSYCHTCSGGIANLVLQFHPRVQDTIVGYMDSINCDLISQGISAVADAGETLEDTPIEIDALANDESQSCDAFTLTDYDSVSADGGSVELLAGQGPGGRDLFLYTPAEGYSGVDSFGYSITGVPGTQSTTVSVNVRALRPADDRLNPIAGLGVRYYALSAPSVLPDFDSLEPYASDVASDVVFPSTGGDFMNSGRADDVGAVLDGYVWALLDGIYTFTTDSDDGSRLYIGDELIVDNDGLHGMVKRGGTIPLSAGWHQIRIEFFERGGGAGLISTFSGPGQPEIDLQGLFLTHEANAQCSVADLNADGALDFFDVSAFITAFNNGDPDADLTGDGSFNFFDVSAFLVAFNAGCP